MAVGGAIIRVPLDIIPSIRTTAISPVPAGVPAAGGGLSVAADRIMNFACQQRRQNPQWWRNPVDEGANFLSGGQVNLMWQLACQPYDNRAPGVPGFPTQTVGGQCAVLYDIPISGTLVNGAVWSQIPRLLGPIRSVSLDVRDFGASRFWDAKIVWGPSSTVAVVPCYSGTIANTNAHVAGWNYSLARFDGLPDSCGSAPPPPLPVSPPNMTGNIVLNVGGQNVNVPIRIGPVSFPDWPNTPFNPEITLNGNVTVNLTPQDVVFNFPGGLPGLPSVNLPSLNPVVEISPQIEILSGNTVNIQNDVSIIRDIVEEGVEVDLSRLESLIRACCCNPEYDFSVETLAVSVRGGTFDLPSGCYQIVVTKTGGGSGSPVEVGEGVVPDINYWGWFAWGGEGRPGLRQQLQWTDSCIPVPSNATTVTVFGKYLSTMSVVALIKNKVVPA